MLGSCWCSHTEELGQEEDDRRLELHAFTRTDHVLVMCCDGHEGLEGGLGLGLFEDKDLQDHFFRLWRKNPSMVQVCS